jgi:tubulin monoglycylase TTLL3/8
LQKLANSPVESQAEILADFETVFKQEILSKFKLMKEKDPQFELYGKDHLWIMKPGTSSRGRGIEVFSCFDKMMERRSNNRDIPWIIQKYMENSLLVKGRKFDIRQWVLVTDWNPLTVWFYEDCYVRFSCQAYDSTDLNCFIHLTNNSISKHKKVDFESEEQKFFGKNMWSSDRFAEWLRETTGQDVYGEKIKPRIRDIVLWTMSSGQDSIENRKNSMELYGLDLMVDEDFNTYLIEVNSSPSFEHSTPITSKLVQEVSEDVIKVTVDNLNGRRKVLGDTGKFTCLVRRKNAIPKPVFYMNFNLPVVGKKMVKQDVLIF